MLPVLFPLLSLFQTTSAQVTATFPNGATNPAAPSFYPVGAQVNQTSFSRLLSLNGIDDFCMFGPPEAGPESLIGNVEPIVVAYCTKPRNGARLIPDGAITGAHLVKTPLYIQIHGFWDGTKVNIPAGDAGGELDPHGAENLGNPIGGNVTTNLATGKDVFYEEWMSFISYDQFCMRICTAENGNVTTALQCEHELDIMGCQFVMAIENFYQTNNSFTSCDGEPAAPPGLYPLTNGSTSTFRQRYTGSYVDGAGATQAFTVGQTVTPSAPAFYPKTSNCVTYSTISNGVNTANYMVTAAPVLLQSGSSMTATGVASTSGASTTPVTGAANATSTGRNSTTMASSSGTTSRASSSTGGAVSSAATNAAAATSSKAAASRVALTGASGLVGAVIALFGVGAGAIFVL